MTKPCLTQEEADILYLYFKKPHHANHSEMTEDEIIDRYEGDELLACPF
ncbi:MAG: DUF2283 domain-containing protein [Chitinophagaceae bacterium]|nr:MAG: DUF2283 domain-containing protein [Chitinophagaceae bacterium]